jgi:hypothetical protein
MKEVAEIKGPTSMRSNTGNYLFFDDNDRMLYYSFISKYGEMDGFIKKEFVGLWHSTISW